MKYFALFIGNFPTYSITLRAANITEVVSQIEKSYSFTQGPMHLEIYNSNKKLVKTLYPFKIEGYTKKCPCGKKPHYCNFKAGPDDFYWDECYDYEIYERTRKFKEGEEDYNDEEEYYSDKKMQRIKENDERKYVYYEHCPYRKVYEMERESSDYKRDTEYVVMYAECCMPLETRYVFAPSLKSAKKLERKFFKYPVNTTKI